MAILNHRTTRPSSTADESEAQTNTVATYTGAATDENNASFDWGINPALKVDGPGSVEVDTISSVTSRGNTTPRDIEFTDGAGPIIEDSNGDKYRVIVDPDAGLITEKIFIPIVSDPA